MTACPGHVTTDGPDGLNACPTCNPAPTSILNRAEDREALHAAVGSVLVNAMNFPERVQARMLGQDMGPLMDAVTDAVLAAGFHRSQPARGAFQ